MLPFSGRGPRPFEDPAESIAAEFSPPPPKRTTRTPKKKKSEINLTLEPSSLFPRLEDSQPVNSQVLPVENDFAMGPLTGFMMHSARDQRMRDMEDNEDELRPPYGPLTAVMLRSGSESGGTTTRLQPLMHPFMQGQFDDTEVPPPLPTRNLPNFVDSDPLRTPSDILNYVSPSFATFMNTHSEPSNMFSQFQTELEPLPNSETSLRLTREYEQANPQFAGFSQHHAAQYEAANTEPVSATDLEWPRAKEVYLNEEPPAAHVGAEQIEGKVLTNLDRLTTTYEMTQSVINKIDFTQSKRPKSKKLKYPVPKMTELTEEFRNSDAESTKIMCKFTGCCFNQVGFPNRSSYKRHVDQDHFAERITCPWCDTVYSRSDAATRHINRKHTVSERQQINAKKAKNYRSLILNRFILSAPLFVPPMKDFHNRLSQGSLRPYSRREEAKEDDDGWCDVEGEEGEENQENQEENSEENTKSAFEGTSSIPDPSKHDEPLKNFIKSEEMVNAKINYVLATDAYSGHIRDLMRGTVDF